MNRIKQGWRIYGVSASIATGVQAAGMGGGAQEARAQFVCVDTTNSALGASANGAGNVACGTSAQANGSVVAGHIATTANTAFGTGADAGGNVIAFASTFGTSAANTAVGSNSKATGNGSNNVAIGSSADAVTNGSGISNNIAIGFNARSSSTSGSGFNATIPNNIAIGANAVASRSNSMALGNGASASTNQISFGNNAVAQYTFQNFPFVAGATTDKLVTVGTSGDLGTTTVAGLGLATATSETTLQTQVGTVQGTANSALTTAVTAQGTANTALTNAATAQGTANTALTTANGALQRSGGTMTGAISMGGNAITNLAAPVAAGDAANKGYVTQLAALTGTSANLQSQIDGLGQQDKKLASGIAISLALAQPVLLSGQTFALRAGYGTFKGSNAGGISASGLIARNFAGHGSSAVLNGGVGFGTNTGEVAGRAGVTIGF